MSDVKFVRIRGRIVPIRKKDNAKEGTALLGASALIAGAGGYISGAKTRRAERAHQMAFDFGMNNPDTPSNIQKTLAGFKAARKRLHTAKRFSMASRFIATGIGTVAISKLLSKEDDSGLKEAGNIAVAAGVSEVASRGIYLGFKKRLPFGLKFSPNTKSSTFNLLKNIVKSRL